MPTGKAEVQIRRSSDRPECEVIVAVRGKRISLRCPDYDYAMRWARIECKSYGIASVTVEGEEAAVQTIARHSDA